MTEKVFIWAIMSQMCLFFLVIPDSPVSTSPQQAAVAPWLKPTGTTFPWSCWPPVAASSSHHHRQPSFASTQWQRWPEWCPEHEYSPGRSKSWPSRRMREDWRGRDKQRDPSNGGAAKKEERTKLETKGDDGVITFFSLLYSHHGELVR